MLSSNASLGRGLLVGLCLGPILLLVGCSKTVRWDEEVLLNNGKLITVRRAAELHYDISQDRLFRPYWQFRAESLNFEWHGTAFVYRSAPRDPDLATVPPLALAIDPDGRPVVIGYADTNWVQQKSQGCPASPIVVLRGDASIWRKSQTTPPWVLGVKLNLEPAISPPAPDSSLTWTTKASHYAELAPEARVLNLNFVIDGCKGSKS